VKKLLLFAVVFASLQSHAALEVYKGQSEFGDESTGKSCIVTLDRDEKSNEILAVKVAAPARVSKREAGTTTLLNSGRVHATEGREGLDTAQPKKFSQFKFRKLSDIQGEGYMLRGERLVKSSDKAEKVFIHFDVQGGAIQGIEFSVHKNSSKEKTASGDRISIDKMCSGLKKSNVITR
jgi:hypothetical protein